MVSFQAPVSPNPTNPYPYPSVSELENFSKKRKWETSGTTAEIFKFQPKAEAAKPSEDIELHLETPLPLDWQRCLDIQSGQIHFYNTRTQKRTSRDPRASPERLSHSPMSLELELNLPRYSLRGDSSSPTHNPKKINPSWLAAVEDDNQEMVAAVCKQCHMLVMLCKSSPACPNCKFMHPPDQTPPDHLFKPRFSFFC